MMGAERQLVPGVKTGATRFRHRQVSRVAHQQMMNRVVVRMPVNVEETSSANVTYVVFFQIFIFSLSYNSKPPLNKFSGSATGWRVASLLT